MSAEYDDLPEPVKKEVQAFADVNVAWLSKVLSDAGATVEITKGSINESLAHPRDIFRPVIGQSAYAFVLVHNLCVATHRLCNVY